MYLVLLDLHRTEAGSALRCLNGVQDVHQFDQSTVDLMKTTFKLSDKTEPLNKI